MSLLLFVNYWVYIALIVQGTSDAQRAVTVAHMVYVTTLCTHITQIW